MSRNFVTNFRGENYFTPNGKLRIKEEPVTPCDEDFGDHNNMDYSFDNENGSLKKSLSMSDITALRDEFLKLNCDSDKHDIYQRYRRPTGAPHELSKTKFVSMAEAIYHYQRDTPGRFHSTRPRLFQSQGVTGPSGLTVPQSPTLRSKARSRPVYILSQKDKEEMEIEEIKKFKIKANPIPKSVIEGPQHLPDVPKKPITVPEPFKLTEVRKKSTVSSEQIQKFKARPVPKHILEKSQVLTKLPVQITKPKFYHKRSQSTEHLNQENKLQAAFTKGIKKPIEKPFEKLAEKTIVRHGPVRPEPFSFEKRNEEIKKQKEEKIKRQIEEERKLASLFKAQPLPGVVKKRMQNITAKSSSSTTSENKENYPKFEARPPVVLYKEPFKPALKPLQLIKSAPFDLITEKRAAEREKFEQLLKEKEEEQERLKQQKENEQREAEERARTELRAKLVHHAKPVPAKNAFVPEKSIAPLTVPETPKFVRRLKQN